MQIYATECAAQVSTLACSILRRTPCGSASSVKLADLGQRSLSKIYRGSAPAANPFVLRSLFRSFFWSLFKSAYLRVKFRSFVSMLPELEAQVAPLGLQVGGPRGILGPSWGPKSFKNRSKNRSLVGSLFLIDFWSIFRGFWCQLGVQNRSKIDKNQGQNMMIFWPDFWSIFYRSLIDFETLKPWFLTNSPREIGVLLILLYAIFVRFFNRFWDQNDTPNQYKLYNI